MGYCFLEKSKHNDICGKHAQNLDYYDVATSRLYYSAFLKSKALLKKWEIDLNSSYKEYCDEMDPDEKKPGIHEYLAMLIQMEAVNRKSNYETVRSLSKLSNLRIQRNKADYDDNFISEGKFDNEILEYYQSVSTVLDDLLK